MTGPARADGGAPAAEGAPETVIGLEVHVQLRTETKMFCACPAAFGAPPNTHVCPVCLGLPGALPVPNREAVELAVRAALALGCRVHERSVFERKHYVYPDLPKGYQITQYAWPLATGGEVMLRREGEQRRVRVRRLHLEEDAGKSVHDRVPGRTAVDLNRAGVPLVEIVTEPDLRSPAEARALLVRLRQLLEHYAAVSDCNMEEGSLRVDANISVRPARGAAADPEAAAADPEGAPAGPKVEVKNMNSFAFVEKALAYEAERQAAALAEGAPLARETRTFDPERGETRPMRGKEEDFDYRYVPDPDLGPLDVSAETRERERAALGELPHEIERRLVLEHGLPEADAAYLAGTPDRAAYFRAAVGAGDGEPAGKVAEPAEPEEAEPARTQNTDLARTLANFVKGELAAALKGRPEGTAEADLVAPRALRRVAELRLEGVLSSDTAARALEILAAGEGEDLDALVQAHGLAQVRDESRLAAWVEAVVAAHPEEAARYAAGEEKLLGFFMGQVMRAAGGRADPAAARDLLRERLGRKP